MIVAVLMQKIFYLQIYSYNEEKEKYKISLWGESTNKKNGNLKVKLH